MKIENFLKSNFPGKKWGKGPTEIISKSVSAAYGKLRFFYVFTSDYPVARLDRISAVLSIDPKDVIRKLGSPESFNHGLMQVKDDDTARIAASAIMSLTFGPFGPVEVSSESVKIEKRDGGRLCMAEADNHCFRVAFDNKGRCIEVSHTFKGSLPICIGGLFLALEKSQLAAPGLPPGTGALRLVSIERGSIAEKGGLKVDDIIIALNGKPLPSRDTIQSTRNIVYSLKQKSHASCELSVIRAGRALRITLSW